MNRLLLFVLLPVLFGWISPAVADNEVAPLLQLFQTNETAAQTALFTAISTPSFFVPNAKVLKTLPEQERVALVESAGKQIKAYTGSPEFLARYNSFRESKKPKPPEAPKSSRQLQDEQRQNLQNTIAELERNQASGGKEQQELMRQVIAQMRQQASELDQAGATMFPPEMDGQLQQVYSKQMEEHGQRLAAWEQAYPVDNPKPMIKGWLNAFLDKSAEVDFNAQTTEIKPGLVRFTNQELERKDKAWKLFYRAGKETVTAARSFAQAWLAELNR